jgi:hypothetical protein
MYPERITEHSPGLPRCRRGYPGSKAGFTCNPEKVAEKISAPGVHPRNCKTQRDRNGDSVVGPVRAVRLWPMESEASHGRRSSLKGLKPRRGDRWLPWRVGLPAGL